jgi:hypothetical protein
MHGAGSSDESTDADEPAEADDSAAVTQAGVLGNLPKTRPVVRSPRRAMLGAEQPAPSRSEPSDPRPRDRPGPDVRGGGSPEPSGGTDIEALARGGIAIAGEAASLGLRIAGRAAAAVRDAVERR